MATRILVNSPILNEVVFDYLFGMTTAQKHKFAPKELRAIKTPKKARMWAQKCTIDEKLLMLAKLGVEFSFIIHAGKFGLKEIKERFEKYNNMSKAQFVQEMTDERFVVLNDRVLIDYLNVMANLTHSETYLLNLDFHKVGPNIHNWKKYDRPDVDSLQDSIYWGKLINRFSLYTAIEMKRIKGVSEIADLDIVLLMYLYDFKGRYVPRATIESYLAGIYKKTLIGSAIKRQFEKLFIERNPVGSKVEYQITGLGASTVMDFHRKNLSQTV